MTNSAIYEAIHRCLANDLADADPLEAANALLAFASALVLKAAGPAELQSVLINLARHVPGIEASVMLAECLASPASRLEH